MMRERSMETQEMCELRRASDRKRKAGKRASENDDEVSVQRLMDRKRKAACRANETEHVTISKIKYYYSKTLSRRL